MKKNNETAALKEMILVLLNKQEVELKLLNEQFQITLESLKPINIIKSTFKEVTGSAEIRKNLVNTIFGFTTGYLSKAILFGANVNPVTKLIGTLFQYGVTHVVAKHSDSIKSAGAGILHYFFKNKKREKHTLNSENGFYA